MTPAETIADAIRAVLKTMTFSHVQMYSKDRITLVSCDSITFDDMTTLSEYFGTRKINIDCDTGCYSDPSHETDVYVNDPTKNMPAVKSARPRFKWEGTTDGENWLQFEGRQDDGPRVFTDCPFKSIRRTELATGFVIERDMTWNGGFEP